MKAWQGKSKMTLSPLFALFVKGMTLIQRFPEQRCVYGPLGRLEFCHVF
jgi:hypothetical protein